MPTVVKNNFVYLLTHLLSKLKCFPLERFFVQMGFFNEADTLESSSILIYSQSMVGLHTQRNWQDAI